MREPTEAQVRYLRAVHQGDVNIGSGYVNRAPSGITMTTHDICLRNGWVRVAAGAWNEAKPVMMTEAGYSAVAALSRKDQP